MEVNDGSSTQRYCGPYYVATGYSNGVDGSYYGGNFGGNLGSSIPGPFTSTATITVKFRSDTYGTRSGFLAVICCAAHVTTDLMSGELINTFH